MQARARFATALQGRRAIVWFALLSLFDAIATDTGLRMNAIREGNPFAAWLYEAHPGFFYAYKFALPLTLLLLFRYIDKPSMFTKSILAAANLVFALLAFYHLGWLLLLAAGM
ncbi:DUF5658 family protein [Paenibacillus silvisoli]|uniref:DUF5658 family protein n=1 Tax=Paenibacillus silvisoli TaxID=3110539 RepID=UPI002804EDDB|nr:DUF5658 family protein [Paenibacillus silvisoli]